MGGTGELSPFILPSIHWVLEQKLKTPVFQEAASKFKGILIESESAAKDRKRNNQ